VPELNLLVSRSGGTREILPADADPDFFDPSPDALCEALAGRLREGPAGRGARAAYDARAANARWLQFHERVCRFARPAAAVPAAPRAAEPRVDVCVAHRNHGRYLPQLLEALAGQTRGEFTVTVVDDASADPASREVFAAMRRTYAPRGWRFEEWTTNRGHRAARNAAAAAGRAPYLLFLDADNVPLPAMVERYLRAAERSGDDCLTCYFLAFRGEGPPYARSGSGAVRAAVRAVYEFVPLGGCAALGLFENFFGDASFLVRRSVFEREGGFPEGPEWRGLAHEDYAFLLRLVLGGYRVDVVPEALFYYRITGSGLTGSTGEYRNRLAVQRIYGELLGRVGLHGLAPFLFGLYERGRPLEFLAEEVRRGLRDPAGALRAVGRAGLRRIRGRRAG
jgi:GT2 family glycosyltransferase